MTNIQAVKATWLSKSEYDTRYVIIDTETGEILDDAQGYGYKTPQKAYKAYAYKNRDKSKDAEKQKKIQTIRHWMKKHKSFVNAMNQYAFEIEVKHSWGSEDKFDAKFVTKMLSDANLSPEFTAAELLKVWRKS